MRDAVRRLRLGLARSWVRESQPEGPFGRSEGVFRSSGLRLGGWHLAARRSEGAVRRSEGAFTRSEGLFRGSAEPLLGQRQLFLTRRHLLQATRSSELPLPPSNLPKAPPLGERKSQRGAFGPENPQILWFFRISVRFRASAARVAQLSGDRGSGLSGRRRWCPCRAHRVWRPVSHSRGRPGPPHRCPSRPA